MDQYEVIVVGAGPPGLTAGLYCGGAQLKTLILGNVRVRRARERREGGTRNREKRSRGKVKART